MKDFTTPKADPETIAIPSQNDMAYSGKYILENRLVIAKTGDMRYNIPTMYISLKGDEKFDRCVDFAKKVGDAMRHSNAEELQNIISSLNGEIKKRKLHIPPITKEDVSVIASEIVKGGTARERALSYIYAYKMNIEAGGYDKVASESQRAAEGPAQEIQRRVVETYLAREPFQKDKERRLETAARLSQAARENSKKSDERYTSSKGEGTITENTKDFGGKGKPGLICRHQAYYMAAMFYATDPDLPTVYAFPCDMVGRYGFPGPHVSCVSTTGNIIEATTEAGEDPYHYNLSEFNLDLFARPEGLDFLFASQEGNIDVAYTTRELDDAVVPNLEFEQSYPNRNLLVFLRERMDQCQNDLKGFPNADEYKASPITDPANDPRSTAYEFNYGKVHRSTLLNYIDLKYVSGSARRDTASLQMALADAGALRIRRDDITTGYHPDIEHVPMNKKKIPIMAEGDLGHMEGQITVRAARDYVARLYTDGLRDLREADDEERDRDMLSPKQVKLILKGLVQDFKKRDSVRSITWLSAQCCAAEGGVNTSDGRIAGLMGLVRAADYIDRNYNIFTAAEIEQFVTPYCPDLFKAALDKYPKVFDDDTEKGKAAAIQIIHHTGLQATTRYIIDKNLTTDDVERIRDVYARSIEFVLRTGKSEIEQVMRFNKAADAAEAAKHKPKKGDLKGRTGAINMTDLPVNLCAADLKDLVEMAV